MGLRPTTTQRPVIINSYAPETHIAWSALSVLPTVQSLKDDQDYSDVQSYAFGVKASLAKVIGDENPINLNTRSAFVREMHAANLTVHAQNFKDD